MLGLPGGCLDSLFRPNDSGLRISKQLSDVGRIDGARRMLGASALHVKPANMWWKPTVGTGQDLSGLTLILQLAITASSYSACPPSTPLLCTNERCRMSLRLQSTLAERMRNRLEGHSHTLISLPSQISSLQREPDDKTLKSAQDNLQN